MKLLTRVSAFFLGALAIALVGYSAVMYYLISDYLYRRFDSDLHSALDLLSASVEVEPDDAKWHPAEHGIDLSQPAFEEVYWIVSNETGQMVDRSPRLVRTDPHFSPIVDYARQRRPASSAVEVAGWRVLQRELSAPNPKPVSLREPHEYTSVRITVGRPLEELAVPLGRLTWIVCSVPAATWLIAAGGGRWFVGQALRPVHVMAQAAQSSRHADFSLRLPVNASGDELSELAAAFNQLLDNLQGAFDRQRRFTGDAAHQLRTPLTILQGQIDVARRRPRSTEEYQQTLDLLARETTELTRIVESLLFLARFEREGTLPQLEEVELDVWLGDYIERWKEHPRYGDLLWKFETSAQAKISTSLLSQTLDNLIDNAFSYSRAGQEVSVTAGREDSKAVIIVKDQGMGISPKDRKSVFEPFFRSAEARHSGTSGTGLGLAIARRITEAMGGRIFCDSSPGRGSEFSLVLPVENLNSSLQKASEQAATPR